MNKNSNHYKLAKEISKEFSYIPEVIAVALGGSSIGIASDQESDIDLYIFTNAPVPLETRRAIAQNHNATRTDLDLKFWDPGDEWFDGGTGIEVDIMYWDPRWIEDQINLCLDQHKASLGYSTCTWHTIKHARVLKDRRGWLRALKEVCNQPYPEPLRQAIIRNNYPVLRDVIPAYLHQIEKAVLRSLGAPPINCTSVRLTACPPVCPPKNAEGGTRTPTGYAHSVLNAARLPIPPLRREHLGRSRI